MRAKAHKSAGITVIELLVVMTLLAIATAFVVPTVGAGLDNMTLRSTGRRLVAVFRQSQTEARTGQQPVALRIESGRIMFVGTADPGPQIDLDESVAINGGTETTYLFLGTGHIVGPERLPIENRRGRRAAIVLGPMPGQIRFVEEGIDE